MDSSVAVIASLGFALAVSASGCADNEFRCSDSSQCGDGGVCELTGYCSNVDPSCPSGRRYASLSGSLSGECVVDPAQGSSGPATSSSPTTNTGGLSTGATTGAESSGASTTTSDTDPQTTTGPEPLAFVDDDAADFDAGTYADTVYTDGLRLDADQLSGSFISRVFDAGAEVTWATLQWTPRGPYSKPLPDGGASEVGYAEGNADMSDNALLLHFDDHGELSPGTTVTDSSPEGHSVQLLGSGNAPKNPFAPLGEALSLTGANYLAVHHDDSVAFQFGEGGFTWSAWVRTASSCAEESAGVGPNQVYMGMESTMPSGRPHLWLGCFNPYAPQCSSANVPGWLGGTITDELGNGVGSFCSESSHVDNQWHHIALVKSGHASATLSTWLDGVLVDTENASYGTPITFSPGEAPFTLGALSEAFYATVDLDEVAVFGRALDPSEVGDLYRRGGLRLSLQIRVCDEPTCTDVPFVGPDQTTDTVYADVSLAPGETAELPAISGRYFQYAARLGGVPQGTGAHTPVLERVQVTATP